MLPPYFHRCSDKRIAGTWGHVYENGIKEMIYIILVRVCYIAFCRACNIMRPHERFVLVLIKLPFSKKERRKSGYKDGTFYDYAIECVSRDQSTARVVPLLSRRALKPRILRFGITLISISIYLWCAAVNVCIVRSLPPQALPAPPLPPLPPPLERSNMKKHPWTNSNKQIYISPNPIMRMIQVKIKISSLN